MKISVIVPVYNVEKYIAKCLDSLVNQTLDDVEIIVVNDGSLDESQKIIDKYIKKYPQKIKSVIKKNGGQGSARNFGLKYATGEYIAYVDSDDWVELDMFEKMYNNAQKNNSDIVVCGNKVISMDNSVLKIEPAIYFDDVKLNILFGKMAVWNKIYKREIISKKNIEFRHKVWYEDIDFTTKLIFNNYKISFIDEPLYNYLLRPGSTMNNSNIDRNLELLNAFDEIKKFYDKDYKSIYSEVEFLAIYHIYIATIVRVINAHVDCRHRKEIINKLIYYMKTNFKSFKSNKYLRYLDRNKKLIYKLINLKLYFAVKFIFKLKSKI